MVVPFILSPNPSSSPHPTVSFPSPHSLLPLTPLSPSPHPTLSFPSPHSLLPLTPLSPSPHPTLSSPSPHSLLPLTPLSPSPHPTLSFPSLHSLLPLTPLSPLLFAYPPFSPSLIPTSVPSSCHPLAFISLCFSLTAFMVWLSFILFCFSFQSLFVQARIYTTMSMWQSSW